MACSEELAKVAKSNKIEDQMLVLMGRQVETELKLEEKFHELWEEVSTVDKEKEDVVKELERLNGNHVAKENARLLRRGQKRDLDNMTRLQIMVNESHLIVREKHTFFTKMNLGTLELSRACVMRSSDIISDIQRIFDEVTEILKMEKK
ncbi:hypothetical protein Tco_1342053 [Tanacetum coccineum]